MTAQNIPDGERLRAQDGEGICEENGWENDGVVWKKYSEEYKLARRRAQEFDARFDRSGDGNCPYCFKEQKACACGCKPADWHERAVSALRRAGLMAESAPAPEQH